MWTLQASQQGEAKEIKDAGCVAYFRATPGLLPSSQFWAFEERPPLDHLGHVRFWPSFGQMVERTHDLEVYRSDVWERWAQA